MIVRQLEAIFNFKYNPEGFKKATSALDNFAQKANMVLGAIASHYAVQALMTISTNVAQALDQVGKSSSNLGISTQSFQELAFAAQKTGMELDNFEDCMKELMLRSRDALLGTGDAAEGFLALGISVKDSSGLMREPLGLLDEVADKVKNMPTQSDKIWALDKLFGDPGYVMLNMLDKGSAGIKQMRQEAQELGVALDSDSILRARNFNQALKDMQMSSGGFTKALVSAMLPALTWVMKGLAKLTAIFNQVESRASSIRIIFTALGLALSALAIKAAITFAPAIASMAPFVGMFVGIIAGSALAALVIEDLWVAFNGGDSVFGQLYDKAKELFTGLTEWISNLWKNITQVFGNIKERFSQIIPDFLKNSFKADIKLSDSAFKLPSDSRAFMPSQVSNLNQSSQTSQQNISVAVNVKSGANPGEIGSEVSKAVRRELDRERANAFMGVSQYAA